MKKYTPLIQYFYNEHNMWRWEEKHEADLKLLDKLPNAISKVERFLLISKMVLENYIRIQNRDIGLEKKIETHIGKVNLVLKMLTEKYNVPITTRIVLRDASKERLGTIEHLLADHKTEIIKDYNKYISKIKESIINPIDVKKVDENKFYLYAFYGISKRKRKGINKPKIFMQTIIQKEKDSDYYTVVSAFPNIK